MRNSDTLNPTGHLEILKIYPDGTEELHWSDHNVITSGMGVTLGYLFSETGSSSILDFQLAYAQVGVSGSANYGTSTFKLVSSVPYSQLSGNDLIAGTHSQLQNGTTFTDQPFISIAPNNVYRASPTSVRYHIIIPQNALNLSVPLNEIGLFSKNPRQQSPEESILVAYKSFSNLLKFTDFSLLFRWTIYF